MGAERAAVDEDDGSTHQLPPTCGQIGMALWLAGPLVRRRCLQATPSAGLAPPSTGPGAGTVLTGWLIAAQPNSENVTLDDQSGFQVGYPGLIPEPQCSSAFTRAGSSMVTRGFPVL